MNVATGAYKVSKDSELADFPIAQPKKFELVFNLKAVKRVGLTIPQRTLMKADKVIR